MSKELSVPLKEENIKYHFTVKGHIAYHNLNIKYKGFDPDNKLSFRFCLSEDACFDHLSIKIEDWIMECIIKEKEKSK